MKSVFEVKSRGPLELLTHTSSLTRTCHNSSVSGRKEHKDIKEIQSTSGIIQSSIYTGLSTRLLLITQLYMVPSATVHVIKQHLYKGIVIIKFNHSFIIFPSIYKQSFLIKLQSTILDRKVSFFGSFAECNSDVWHRHGCSTVIFDYRLIAQWGSHYKEPTQWLNFTHEINFTVDLKIEQNNNNNTCFSST